MENTIINELLKVFEERPDVKELFMMIVSLPEEQRNEAFKHILEAYEGSERE